MCLCINTLVHYAILRRSYLVGRLSLRHGVKRKSYRVSSDCERDEISETLERGIHPLAMDSIFTLPNEVLLSSICAKFPCRDQQIRSLATLLSVRLPLQNNRH